MSVPSRRSRESGKPPHIRHSREGGNPLRVLLFRPTVIAERTAHCHPERSAAEPKDLVGFILPAPIFHHRIECPPPTHSWTLKSPNQPTPTHENPRKLSPQTPIKSKSHTTHQNQIQSPTRNNAHLLASPPFPISYFRVIACAKVDSRRTREETTCPIPTKPSRWKRRAASPW
jgi:hypothetical protein